MCTGAHAIEVERNTSFIFLHCKNEGNIMCNCQYTKTLCCIHVCLRNERDLP